MPCTASWPAYPNACQHAVLNGALNLGPGWIQQAGHPQEGELRLNALIVGGVQKLSMRLQDAVW